MGGCHRIKVPEKVLRTVYQVAEGERGINRMVSQRPLKYHDLKSGSSPCDRCRNNCDCHLLDDPAKHPAQNLFVFHLPALFVSTFPGPSSIPCTHELRVTSTNVIMKWLCEPIRRRAPRHVRQRCSGYGPGAASFAGRQRRPGHGAIRWPNSKGVSCMCEVDALGGKGHAWV